MVKLLNSAAILIIEDDEDSLLVTRRLLQLAGVTQIVSFRSGGEALAKLKGPVNLVLLDVQLGHEDGRLLAQKFRQDERLASAMLVALTANVLPEEVQQIREAGFDGLIGKPLSFEHFAEQLQQLLDGQSVWQTR
jgi:CheY-like chemotaxis protein